MDKKGGKKDKDDTEVDNKMEAAKKKMDEKAKPPSSPTTVGRAANATDMARLTATRCIEAENSVMSPTIPDRLAKPPFTS